jgi:hypothetical protein
LNLLDELHDNLDELRDNKVWTEFQRQWERNPHPHRMDLAGLWRVAGKPWLSPRRFKLKWHEVQYEGTRPDDPAWADGFTAIMYAQLLDGRLMKPSGPLFRLVTTDPVGALLVAPEEFKPEIAVSASALYARYVHAGADGDRGDRTGGDKAILKEIVRRTEGLDLYRRETVIAQCQRALTDAKRVRTGYYDGGEYIEDH